MGSSRGRQRAGAVGRWLVSLCLCRAKTTLSSRGNPVADRGDDEPSRRRVEFARPPTAVDMSLTRPQQSTRRTHQRDNSSTTITAPTRVITAPFFPAVQRPPLPGRPPRPPPPAGWGPGRARAPHGGRGQAAHPPPRPLRRFLQTRPTTPQRARARPIKSRYSHCLKTKPSWSPRRRRRRRPQRGADDQHRRRLPAAAAGARPCRRRRRAPALALSSRCTPASSSSPSGCRGGPRSWPPTSSSRSPPCSP